METSSITASQKMVILVCLFSKIRHNKRIARQNTRQDKTKHEKTTTGQRRDDEARQREKKEGEETGQGKARQDKTR
jgi:hypothetical protein